MFPAIRPLVLMLSAREGVKLVSIQKQVERKALSWWIRRARKEMFIFLLVGESDNGHYHYYYHYHYHYHYYYH